MGRGWGVHRQTGNRVCKGPTWVMQSSITATESSGRQVWLETSRGGGEGSPEPEHLTGGQPGFLGP